MDINTYDLILIGYPFHVDVGQVYGISNTEAAGAVSTIYIGFGL
jgi:hypothetical protein